MQRTAKPYHHLPARPRALLGFLFLLLYNTSFAQHIIFNRVAPPPGKSFFHVTGMVQDRQGYVWLATKNGLFKYDGYQYTQYRNNPIDASTLGSDFLECIGIDRDGLLWIGTFSSGLDRMDPTTGKFTHFRHDPENPSSLANDTVSALLVDKYGTLWVGAGSLDRFDPGTNSFTHFRNNPDVFTSLSCDEVRTIYEDREGSLWIGTGSVYSSRAGNPQIGGLNRMDRKTGRFERFMSDPGNPNSLVNNKVRALFEDSKGNFWVGTAGDGLHLMNRSTGTFQHFTYDGQHPERLSRPALSANSAYDHITFITEDARGALWIGTSESGMNYYDPVTKLVTHYSSGKDSAGLFRDFFVWTTLRTREGVLWISTIHGELYRINLLEGSVPFVSVPVYGLHGILESNDNTRWLANDKGGLIHQTRDGKLLKKFLNDPQSADSISGNDVSCLAEDSNGVIWAGTFGNGLNRYDPATGLFAKYEFDEGRTGICNNTIISLYNTSRYLWVSTFDGLSRMDKTNQTFRNYFFHPPNPNIEYPNVVAGVLQDSKGLWWASCWHNGGAVRFDPETGKQKLYLQGASLIKIIEDHAGVIWVAGQEALFYYNREKDEFTKYEDPLFLNETTGIDNLIEDAKGNLWLTTPIGLVRINRERNETTSFGSSYGIRGDAFYALSASRGKDGKLYFGYSGGFFAFYPDDLARGMRPPEIALNAFRLADKIISPQPGGVLEEPLETVSRIKLRYDQDVFSFEFTGIDFSNPEGNRHLFMLENYDKGWNLAGADRKVIYYNVPPGKYIFRMKVVNGYGVWSTRNIEVIITPPWWTTWWFRIGAILLIVGIFYSFVRWQVRQKFNQQLERSEKDKQLAELRQKTGDLEMQALRAQMNPHFVFNSLNAINRFILENNKTQASEYLTKFSRLVRLILQNSQSTLITLESELDSLHLYLELEALRFDHRFAYSVNIAGDLDPDVLKVPPLIIQPYAENAIWHGLMHKEEKGYLEIDIRQVENNLVITVRDNGVGRKQSAARTGKSATKHKSMGLSITADRIAHLQQAGVGAPVVINDLEHGDGSPAGTEVIIKIPVIYDKSDTSGR